MLDATAKVLRITADTAYDKTMIVAGVQVVGGVAATSLYEDTSAVAGNKKVEIVAPAWLEFSTPITFKKLFVDVGTGATEVFIHTV